MLLPIFCAIIEQDGFFFFFFFQDGSQYKVFDNAAFAIMCTYMCVRVGVREREREIEREREGKRERGREGGRKGEKEKMIFQLIRFVNLATVESK